MRRTLFKNPSQIEQKTTPDRWKCVLGAFSAPNRAQVGSMTVPLIRGTRHFKVFWPKMAPQGSISGPPEIPKWLKNRTFVHRLALGPSKNGLREGFWNESKNQWKNHWKKDQKSWKNGLKIHWQIDTFSNLRFLVFFKESYVKMRFLQIQG